jgi:ABC-type phosphate transport system auxiliary subunit
MSVHEFVTISTFYISLLSDGVCSKALAEVLLGKVEDSVTEFNELQLILFKTSLEQVFLRERSLYESDDLARALMFYGDAKLIKTLETTYKAVQTELEELREEKELA